MLLFPVLTFHHEHCHAAVMPWNCNMDKMEVSKVFQKSNFRDLYSSGRSETSHLITNAVKASHYRPLQWSLLDEPF